MRQENLKAVMSESQNPTRKKRPEKIADEEQVRPRFRFRFFENWTFERETLPSLPLAPSFPQPSEFELELAALARQAGRNLGGLEADFAWLAVAVYLADRLSPRLPYGQNGAEYWRRDITIEIPVRDPNHWLNARIELEEALSFLTEDDWSLEFVIRLQLFDAESQRHLEKLASPPLDWAALFSGGLDSLAGALRWLNKSQGKGILVSGQTHNRIALAQREQVAAMRQFFPRMIEHVGVKYQLRKQKIEGFEWSQRTRAFAHIALGALAARMSGCESLFLFENGFGALNLPCDSAQIGSQNSRGTHPTFLMLMSALIQKVFDARFKVANPYTFLTKAEMLDELPLGRFDELLQSSFSCDIYPNYNRREEQCGVCGSCLVRRLAFHASGRPDPGNSYTIDVLDLQKELREREFTALMKLSLQSRALSSSWRDSTEETWTRLASQWPDLLRTERQFGKQSKFSTCSVRLLEKHVNQWRAFEDSIRPKELAYAA
ncbi:MAG: hypothetical protein AAF357_00985 [Verrucomicrobiota bacterium]